MLIQNKKVIQTDQIGKGKVGFVRIIELTMKVSTISVLIVEFISIYLNTSSLPIWARYIGILLMFFNWTMFAVSVLAIVMLHLQIVNVEEDFLTELFKNEYLKYKKKVNRYLGRRL